MVVPLIKIATMRSEKQSVRMTCAIDQRSPCITSGIRGNKALNTTADFPPPLSATGIATDTDSLSAPLADSELLERFAAVRQSLNQRLAGHNRLIERILVAVITGGHVLIEGSPGLAKTRAVNQFASLVDAAFVRVQATPDLLPACLLYTSPSPRDGLLSRMPSSA